MQANISMSSKLFLNTNTTYLYLLDDHNEKNI